jgi:BirA family biotin operon repressor/biotin-[acetyl-CoA-carboxylase] ligase
MSPVDLLDADSLRAALTGELIGADIVVLEETTSTNDVVAQMAATSAEGLVVIAEKQTSGRGQYGRRWESAAGKGLWLSLLLRPQIAVAESHRITDFLAASIVEAIKESVGLQAIIKLPNDVYIGSRKVAGVLVEMRVESTGAYCAVAGMGLNVNHTALDFPPELRETAGSIAMAANHPIDRFRLAIALLRKLNERYAALSRE